MQELAKDSHKYRSKKDRKEQKSSFRDIVKYIEENDEFYERVAFSKRETLELNSWGMKKQYDQLCKVLGSGMNLHLTENELIRSIFGLGSPLPALDMHASSRPSKNERVSDLFTFMSAVCLQFAILFTGSRKSNGIQMEDPNPWQKQGQTFCCGLEFTKYIRSPFYFIFKKKKSVFFWLNSNSTTE